MASKRPRVERMKVTPSMAARWLEKHDAMNAPGAKHNRNRANRHVERMAHDMAAGNWFMTHSPICFDTQGILIDGQHRLAAIVMADVPVDMFVGYDFDPQAKLFCDGGRARTMADIVAIKHGASANRGICSAARNMMDPMMECTASRHEQVLFYEAHADAVHWSYELFHNMPLKELRHSYMIAMVARAYYTQDRELLERFVSLLREPVGMMASDRAAIVLRDDIARTQTKSNKSVKTDRRWMYRRAEYLLDAFLRRNSKPSKSKLAEWELFLVPGEDGYGATSKRAA